MSTINEYLQKTEKTSSCNFCDSINHSFIYSGLKDRTDITSHNFNIVRCNNCGLCFLEPQPTISEIKKHYTNSYRTGQGNCFKETNKPKLAVIIRRLKRLFLLKIFTGLNLPIAKKAFIRNHLSRLLEYFPRVADEVEENGLRVIPALNRGAKVLDIGFGGGLWMQIASDYGWKAAGVEIDTQFVQSAKEAGYQVYLGDFLDINFGSSKFNFIRLNHVLEHMHYPKETLKKCKNLLVKDGYIYVRVPNFNSASQILLGKNYYQLDIPRHLFFFDACSIKNIATEIALKIEIIDYISNPVTWLNSFLNFDELREIALHVKNDKAACRYTLRGMGITLNDYALGDDLIVLLRKT